MTNSLRKSAITSLVKTVTGLSNIYKLLLSAFPLRFYDSLIIIQLQPKSGET